MTANGDVDDEGPLETRERSKSEILAPRTSSQDIGSTPSNLDKDSSAQDVDERVSSNEGLPVKDDDTIVRVVEQEIAEAFDVTADQLNEAAERLLSELEATLGSDDEGGKMDSDTSVIKSDEESDSERSSHFWREGLKGIPDSCIVITDL